MSHRSLLSRTSSARSSIQRMRLKLYTVEFERLCSCGDTSPAMRQQRNSSGSFFVMLQPSGSGQQYSGLPFDPSLLFTSEIAFVSLTNKSISRLRHKTLDTADVTARLGKTSSSMPCRAAINPSQEEKAATS